MTKKISIPVAVLLGIALVVSKTKLLAQPPVPAQCITLYTLQSNTIAGEEEDGCYKLIDGFYVLQGYSFDCVDNNLTSCNAQECQTGNGCMVITP